MKKIVLALSIIALAASAASIVNAHPCPNGHDSSGECKDGGGGGGPRGSHSQ